MPGASPVSPGQAFVAQDEIRVDGGATLYRLYDIGYSLSLERAAELLGGIAHGRVLPARGEARAIQIRNPPLFASLGTRQVSVGATTQPAQLSVHLFDFGVCSLRLQVSAPRALAWREFSAFGSSVAALRGVSELFDSELYDLMARLSPAIERAEVAPLSEDYIVFRIDRIDAPDNNVRATDRFSNQDLAHLLVGEPRTVSAATLRELVPYRFSYYDDDLAVLTWDNALVVEPRAEDRDVEFVLEFANAQLLELRMYDLKLDSALPALYDRVDAVRARRRLRLFGRFREVLSDLQKTVADITETVERAENSLKVTNDVYLARVYAAALELFREQAWRRGIERKLTILRDTYAMLNSEAQAARAELLEVAVVVLIVAELLLSAVHYGRG